MKKIIFTLFLIPLTITLVLTVKHNITLDKFINDNTRSISNNKLKTQAQKTEIHVLGTVHFETENIKREHLYKYIDSISPSIIFYESDASTLKRILKKRDYFFQIINAFKKGKEMEKAVVLKYIDKNSNSTVLPYEWELRNKYHRKHKTRKNSSKMINSVIKLYHDKKLNEEENEVIERFLDLNKAYYSVFKTGNIYDINNSTTDSIIKYRQESVYKKIPEIARNKKELNKFSDYIPFHIRYWDTRNKAMVQNILKQVKANPNKVIVVLNGYSHRYYLIEELKKYEEEFNFSVK
jgi:hypothetical protein